MTDDYKKGLVTGIALNKGIIVNSGECGYISTGWSAPYIDTGYKPNLNTVVKVKLAAYNVTGNLLIGFLADTTDFHDYRIFNYGGQIYYDFGGGTYNRRIYGGTFSTGTVYEYEFGNYYVNQNGTRVLTEETITQNDLSDATIQIGHGAELFDLYYLQIYELGILLHDFVPCVNASAAGLYDKVSKKFYWSENDYKFLAGF